MGLWQNIKTLFAEQRSIPLSDPRASELFLGSPTSAGVTVNEATALTFSAVYQAVRVISEAVAQLPVHVYERGDDGNRTQIDDHWAGWLLRENPNDDMTPFTFKETLQGHICTWGNGYAEIVRNNNAQPVELYPLRPDWMTVRRNAAGELYYEYRDSRRPDGVTRLNRDDVLHIPGLSFDGLCGYSPIRLAMDSLGLGMAAIKYGGKFFENSAQPGGLLKHPKTLSDKAYKRLLRSWEKRHKGPDNVNKVDILEEGLDWVTVGIPPDQAQFVAVREANVEEVARWFNLPPHKLGDLRRATFSNIEQQDTDFLIHSILPWLKRWEQEINRKLFSKMARGRQYVEFSIEGLLRADSVARSQFYTQMLGNGVFTINDVLKKENMPTIGEDGDQRLVPLNMRRLDEPTEAEIQAEQPPPVKPAEPTSEPEKKPEQRSLATQDAIVAAHQELLADVLGRMVGRETDMVRRAAKQPGQFLDKLDKFYAEHRTTLAAAIRPSLRAHYAVLGWQDRSEMVAGFVAEQLCVESRSAWLDLSGSATADCLEAAVNGLAVKWEQGRAGELARRALEEWTDGKH